MDEIVAHIRLFADDCVCYRTVKNVQDCRNLQDDTNHQAALAKSWCMRFEPSKWEIMHVTRKRSPTRILHGELSSRICFSHKAPWRNKLGRPIRWNRHVGDVTCRANQLLGLLRRNLSQENQGGGLSRSFETAAPISKSDL